MTRNRKIQLSAALVALNGLAAFGITPLPAYADACGFGRPGNGCCYGGGGCLPVVDGCPLQQEMCISLAPCAHLGGYKYCYY